MAIGVSNFPIVDNNLAERLLDGFKEGQGLRQNYLANQLAQMQNQNELTTQKYLEPSLQEQLKKAIYENQIQQPIAQNAKAFALADLAYKQAQAPFTRAQTNRINTMTPLDAEKARLANQFYPEATRADIENKKAQANYKNMGGYGMGVGQKELLGLKRQLQFENPEWTPQEVDQAASGYLSGDTQNLPPMSGQVQSFIAQIQKRNSTASIQNQAANADITAQEINDIDISPAKKFAGAKGKINLAAEKVKMAAGLPVDPAARDYLAFQQQAILVMDSLRKSLGTSVVPDYVYATLGKLSNPESPIWNDGTQVEKNWNVLVDWVSKNSSKLKKKATQGAAADISNKSPNMKATLRYNQSTGEFEEIR